MAEPVTLTLPQEFVDKVRIQEGDGCWPWLGEVSSWGYGVTDAGRMAHVWSYALHYGEGKVKPGFQLFHRCGNRLCCRPNHMRLRKKW